MTDWHADGIRGELPPYSSLYPVIALRTRGRLGDFWIQKYYEGANFKTRYAGGSGLIVAKLYYPYNPRTSFQQAWRGVFSAAVASWQGLSIDRKEFYNALKYPFHMSGYNRYLRLYLNANYPPPLGNYLLTEAGERLLTEANEGLLLEQV